MNKLFAIFFGVALATTAIAPAQADPAAGEKAFKAAKCEGCHYTTGPAREKTIADKLAMKGPELWYAGSKFQKAWLGRWLQTPKPIRPMADNSLTEKNRGDHPKVSADDAGNVTDYLMSLTSKDVAPAGIEPKKTPKGVQIFTKKMPCSGCHQYPEKDRAAGGFTGPSLIGAGTRLNPDWIMAYMMKPKTFKPVKMMPVFVDILNEGDMKSVVSLIASFTEE